MPDGDANPALAKAVASELARLRFSPYQGPNGSVSGRAYLTGSYELVPDGDDMVLRLKSATTRPKLVRFVYPRPPLRMMQGLDEASWGRVSFLIDSDGRPKEIVVATMPYSGQLQRELRDSVRKWRFAVETLPPSSEAIRLHQDFVISLAGEDPPSPVPCPMDVSNRLRVEGQDSCMPLFEIIWDTPKLGGTVTIPDAR